MTGWMIYGATGYTGVLLAEAAVRRGERPILAGRSAEKLRPLAARLGLDYRAFALDGDITAQLEGVALVLHAAGPFIHTSTPMLNACLAVGAHYLDITGEIAVFENTFAHDAAARERGIALISGVGFDVVPTDCLSRYVSERQPNAVWLDIVIEALGAGSGEVGMTAGTMKSGIEMLPHGGRVRRGGVIVPYDLGQGAATYRFPHGERYAMPIPWGDVSTAYYTTGIPNITVSVVTPPQQVRAVRAMGYVLRKALQIDPVRAWVAAQIDQRIQGPSDAARQQGRCYIYARATNTAGAFTEAWLETVEGYHFTMLSAVAAVQRVLAGEFVGALTPAKAFGADFVLTIDGTRRYDTLPAA